MPKKGTLALLVTEHELSVAFRETHGRLPSVKEFCELAVKTYGTRFKAAAELGVYENTIRWHLRPKGNKSA